MKNRQKKISCKKSQDIFCEKKGKPKMGKSKIFNSRFFVKKVQQKFRQIEGIQFHDFLCEKKINKQKQNLVKLKGFTFTIFL